MNGHAIAESYRHPAARAQFVDPDYQRPRHVEYLSRLLGDRILKGNARIIVVEPPRHGKTQLCSRWTPLWFLELFPSKRVLLSSYGATYAAEHGRWVRNSIRQHQDKVLVEVVGDSKAADRWNTPEGGGMATTGVGGPMTGRGADLLIVDDPVKDSEEARSDTIKQKTWDWWLETARTRIEPGGSAIVIMTRWSEDDLVGRLLEQDKDLGEWEVVHLAATAEGYDALGRDEGEALWPERYDADALASIKRDVGSHAWAALYQGRPSPAGGGMFQRKHFRYFTEHSDHYELNTDAGKVRVHKKHTWMFQTCDTAMKVGQNNDWTVITTFVADNQGRAFIYNVERERLEIPDQWPFFCRSRDRLSWMSEYRWSGCEDKGSGTGLIQIAQRKGVPLRTLEAVSDKVTRATPAAVHYENEMVFHRANAEWLDAFEHELLTFPNGAHDDQVDTVAYGIRAINTAPALAIEVTAEPEPEPMHDYQPAGTGLKGW